VICAEAVTTVDEELFDHVIDLDDDTVQGG